MTTLRLKRMEVQELLLWAKEYREKQKEVGINWDDDQQTIVNKLRKSIGREEANHGQ